MKLLMGCLILLCSTFPVNSQFNGKPLGKCFSGGCDLAWAINRRVDSGLRSKSDALIGPAKKAFIEATDLLFDQKIGPLVTRLDEISKARLSEFRGLLEQTTSDIEAIIVLASSIAEARIDSSVETIKREIIDTTFNSADALMLSVRKQVDAVIDNVDCKLSGQRDALIVWARSLVRIPNPFSACYRQLGSPKSDDYVNLWRFEKCELEGEIGPESTIEKIRLNYERLSFYARKFACIVGTGPALVTVERDLSRYTDGFGLWDLALGGK